MQQKLHSLQYITLHFHANDVANSNAIRQSASLSVHSHEKSKSLCHLMIIH